jgi:hypothetical protein
MRDFAVDAQHFINRFRAACVNKQKSSIRVQTGFNMRGNMQTLSWDYFELSSDGIIIKAPRGLTKQYKGMKVLNLDKLPPMISPLNGKEI